MSILSLKSLPLQDDKTWREQLLSGKIQSLEMYARFMLQKVSRTFALNILVLPSGLQMEVLLAYLFCRMADTLEDDKNLKPEEKIHLLEQFKKAFVNPENWREEISGLTEQLPKSWINSDSWDQLLTYHSTVVFDLYWQLPKETSKTIARWVTEMCEGMQEFAAKGSNTKSNKIISTMRELDRYCYYVAGTVGNLLCDLFYKYSGLIGKKSKERLEKFSVSFGLGLQLTNILKDVWDDMNRNVVFIPESLLEEHGLSQADLSDPHHLPKLRKLTATLLDKAKNHLTDALEYTCLLPRLEPRLRLFCLWPLFMALDTLILIAKAKQTIQANEKIKISKKQVKQILQETSFICLSNFLIRKKFNKRIKILEKHIFA